MKSSTLYTLGILWLICISMSLEGYTQPFKRFKNQHFKHTYFRVGGSIGLTTYHGDLEGGVQPGFSVMGSYRVGPGSHLRLSVFQGWANGSDSRSENEREQIRNLSFRTPITEASLHYVFDIPIQGRRYDERPTTAFYVWGGIGYYLFKPQTEVDGKWVDLQPLGTEGQQLSDSLGIFSYPNPYALRGWNIPIGLGFRLSPPYQKWDLELEIGVRNLFTDYFDDVSGAYPDMELLEMSNPLSAQLSDRIDRSIYTESRYPGGAPELIGLVRGDSRGVDTYVYTSISFNYILGRIGFKERR